MCWYSGCLVSKFASARGRVVPIRSLSLYDATCDGEHVCAGVLVAAVAGEALLVAVVDDRLAAGEVHQAWANSSRASSSVAGVAGVR